MSKKYVMAIDQGTTGTRVILFNHDGEIHSMGYREIRQLYPQPGWVEHDPDEIWETVLLCTEEACKQGKAEPGEIAAIGITNQRESTILWERDTGRPIYNAICWQCRRSASICDDLIAKGYESPISLKTGLVIDAYFSATKIMWIMDNVEGTRSKIEDLNICMGNIDSWIMWNLSNGMYHVTDFSNASRTLLLNINTLSWDEEILTWTGIPEHILPELKPSSGVMAETDPDIFFGETIPIAGAAGDQQAATFGQTCFKPGMVKNTYGTALSLMMNIGGRPFYSKNKLITDLAWKIGDCVEYAIEGTIFIGGAAIQWLRDGLGIIKNSDECTELAEKIPDTGGVYLVPAFTGLSAPYWDMYARGIIVGITRGTTREHIARSAMESLAYQTRDVLEAMEADSGKKPVALRVDGGASKSDFLMQFQADLLGIEVERPAVTEMAALGACYLAGLGVGFWESKEEIAQQWKIEKVFQPEMDKARRDELYSDWKRAVERSLKWTKP
jgi:glycerol kinase